MPQNVKRVRRDPFRGGLVNQIGRNFDWLRSALDVRRWRAPDIVKGDVQPVVDGLGWPIFKSGEWTKFSATTTGAGAPIDTNIDSGVSAGSFRLYWKIQGNTSASAVAVNWPRANLKFTMDGVEYWITGGDDSWDDDDIILWEWVIVPEGGRLGITTHGNNVTANQGIAWNGLYKEFPHGTYIPALLQTQTPQLSTF